MIFLLRFAKNFLVQLAVISLLLERFIFIGTLYAQDLPIVSDGSTNTQIDRAANEVPLVNIATPNSAGLSHNKFTDYNVNQQGLILNNAIGSQSGVFQTQIGGLINDNANLKNSGSASIILNEVTSNNISQINGYTEIAGKKADLILANPNGIQMNGAGFINVGRLTAIVGSSDQFNSHPNDLTFSLSNHSQINSGFLPKLTIQGAGLDVESVLATDLVAGMMDIVAPVYGKNNEVNLRAGDQTFSYTDKAISSDNSSPGNNLPNQLAIDASNLGKIQAGKIYIIASKEGFGIKWDTDMLASRNGIIIDNQGNISYNNIASNVGNIEVTSRKGSITQTGISQTKDFASDIKLDAFGNIKNSGSGQFLSARNIRLKTLETLRNESLANNFSSNDFDIEAANFVNLGTIAANHDLDIEATLNLNNSKELVAKGTLTLKAPEITNTDSIYSSKKISITATNYLTNDKDIVALGTEADDEILIIAKTLNNNKRIAARKNVTISADSLNNNTANSIILALNNNNLNFTSLDNSGGKIEATNTLAFRNLVLSDPTSASRLLATSQISSITNVGGSIFARSSLDIDLGNYSDYTIAGTLESAGNIKIKAKNITNQTTVKANGYIKIEAADKFTNGSLGGNNSNVKFATETYLDITAQNLLSNYGTLSSKTDLTLTSNASNINNNANAEIIGGTGMLMLSAKNGTVNQNSLHSIVANGNYSLDVTNFVNTGRVDVAGNLTLNVTNNLTNEAAAMIYAGGNMELNVANNLTNKTGAVIYSEGNLTIQKYATTNPLYNPANNKINQLDNISGDIISYNGNVRIDAATLNNKRDDTVALYIDAIRYNDPNFNPDSSWSYYDTWLFGHDDENQAYLFSGKVRENPFSRQSTIAAKETLVINANDVLNSVSSIYSLGNLTINASNFTNEAKAINDTLIRVNTWHMPWEDPWQTRIRDGCCEYSTGGSPYKTIFAPMVKSASNAVINAPNANQTYVTSNASGLVLNDEDSQLTGSKSGLSQLTNGIINTNLDYYFRGPSENGLFQRSANPNGPLFETRSQFIDQSKFFGSNYFYQRIGLNLTDVQTEFEQTSKRLVGDQFFQNKIIAEQLATITKNSFLLSSSETNVNNEIKTLLDNAADEYARLGLATNQALTKTQINSLQKDIVWFETEIINGAAYIVPKIYLSQATKNNLANGNLIGKSAIYAAGDVVINSNAGNLSNSGSIIAGNNVTINNSGNITNEKFSEITAGNSLSLTSTTGSISNLYKLKANDILSLNASNNITNIGGTIKGGNLLYMNAGNNIANQALVDYKINGQSATEADALSSNANRITSSLISKGSFESDGNLVIVAGNSFNNIGSNITAAGSAYIEATNGDINIATALLRDRSVNSWGGKKKGGTSTSDVTANVGSDISVGGDLEMFSGNDLGIKGSDVASAGNLNLIATKEVNITAAQNTSYFDSSSWKKGTTVSKSSNSGNSSVKNVLTDLTSTDGNISITSGASTNIIGGNLKSDDLTINTGGDLNIYSVSDSSSSWESSSKSRNYSAITKYAPGGAILVGATPLAIGAVVATHYGLDTNNSSKSSSIKTDKTSNLASVIEAAGDVALASNLDLTISGSNVSGKTGSLTSNKGDVNIISAIETEETKTSNKSVERATNVPGFKGSKKTADSTTTTITNVASNVTFTDSLAINTNGNSVDPNQTKDINIKGSNVSVTGGDLTIASKGNVAIENAVNSALTESSGKKRNENVASFNRSTNYVETALASNVRAANVNISSLGDTIIQGSNIKTDNNLIIGSFTVAQNLDGSYQKDANGNYVTTSGTTVDNLIIRDADLKEFHDSQSGKGFVGAAGVVMRVAPYALAPIQVVANLTDEYMRILYPDALQNIVRTAYGFTILDKVADKMAETKISTETQTRTESSTSFASNINVGNSMMTNSVGDTLIKGSNLNIGTDAALAAAGGGNLLSNALGSFTVTAGTNTQSTESSSSFETAGKFHSDLSISRVNYKAGVSKDWTKTGDESDSTTLTQSNLNIAGSSLINTTDQFALIASNMATGKSTDIISRDNLNISDGKNTQSTSSYTNNLNLDTGIQIGNAYADATWAVVDAAKAIKAVKNAYDKLNKIEELYKEDQASSKAVERAKLQVVLALVNSGLSTAAAMQAVGNASASSETLGFYGSGYAQLTKSKSTQSTELSQSIASNLISGDSLSLTSGSKDINITGSNISSQNGDLNLTAILGNLNVKAGETTYSQSSKFNSQSLGGSFGNNGWSANIGMGQGESSLDQTTFANSQLAANNGTLKVNTTQDTKIVGANLLAKDIDLTVGGNLTVKSKQNLLESDAYNIGLNIGISGGGSGLGGSIGGNLGDSFQSRGWVDQLTSIIGTNSVAINTTQNTDIIGAMIANKDSSGNDLGNLIINTGSLTYSDLKNYNNSESNNFSASVQFGGKPNNPTAPDKINLAVSMSGNESSSDTKATIGNGAINIGGTSATADQTAGLNRDIAQVEQNKRDVLTSDFDAKLTVPVLLLTNPVQFGKDVKKGYDELTNEEAKNVYRKVWASPNTVIGLTIGLTGYAVGKATGKDVDVRMGENAIQFVGAPFGGGALTLGNVENYFGDAGPDDVWPTYEANDGNWYRTRSINNSVVLGGHEVGHTYQAEVLGPLFLPTYFFAGVGGAAANGVITLNPVNKYNPMEKAADVHGNQILRSHQ